VYFPDRVLPMLPRELSNGICSLNEGVDRLTLSCIMRIDTQGNVKEQTIAKSVICSTHRTTYREIEDISLGKEPACKKYPDLIEFVKNAYALTDILKSMRRKNGEVELAVKEAKILLTEQNEIVIPDYERLKSQEMSEQFMVLANETVATFMTEKKAPFVYRIHEKPKAEKAEELKAFLLSLGVSAPFDPANVSPQEYQRILKNTATMPVFSVINRVMLRSMMKARYDSVNVGHFGLSSKCYCHFTSPIRRYPDLCIHRIIKMVLDGELAEAKKTYAVFASEAAVQSSECERKAVEAERNVDDLYKVMYMSNHIGEEFEGVISGVTAYGVFVELNNTVEGFVSLNSLPLDEYEFLEERFLLRGKKQAFGMGDSLKIQVAGCDFGNREIDFEFLEKIN
ncbi:MAG: VacB/RNase II family 3'-5' exoribonuclease, partial [Clostridia bacterium]|nr:VacB/RNase II family 3'-5' exoribonuclease [Clostridia bacterium]